MNWRPLAMIAAAVLGLVLAGSAQAGVLTVGTGGTYATIQAAVNDAEDGDIIDILSDITEQNVRTGSLTNLTFRGQGADVTTVQAHATRGSATERIFALDGVLGGTFTFQDMTLKHGNNLSTSGYGYAWGGGAIGTREFKNVDLTIERCAFVDNNSYNFGGAVAHNQGPNLTVVDCTFSGNQVATESVASTFGGGALYGLSITDAVIRSSTFSENKIYGKNYQGGGAVQLDPVTSGLIQNSSFVGNEYVGSLGTVQGSAIYGDAVTTVESCLFADNSYAKFYGLVFLAKGSPPTPGTITNCVAEEFFGFPTYATDGGGNTDNIADMLIGALADNGGPTMTHALLEGSPAIDAGSNPAGLTHDQRGAPYLRTVGAGTDIGAFELVPEPATMGLLGLGSFGIAMMRMRRRRR